jgi:hypothetical protein
MARRTGAFHSFLPNYYYYSNYYSAGEICAACGCEAECWAGADCQCRAQREILGQEAHPDGSASLDLSLKGFAGVSGRAAHVKRTGGNPGMDTRLECG